MGTTKQITRHRRISSIDDLIYDLDRAAGAGKTSTMENLPIGCTLRPAALKARRDDLLPGLVRRAVERLEIPNGYRVRFTPDDSVLTTIANVIEPQTAMLQVPDVSPDGRTRQRPDLARTERSSGNERISRRRPS